MAAARGVRLVPEEPPAGERLWWARCRAGGVLGLLREHGRSVRCSRVEREQPLSA
ncbi:hypothetical protein [Streptomyces sp. NPDC020996]|uniref:hypothetical protein n=1 Tax=Streptomyces sp. NPDC020996 TaxID=3154791 RepID=UPI0034107971